METEIEEMEFNSADLNWSDPFLLNGRPIFRGAIGSWMLIQLVYGSVLHLGLASFEHYGGDPKKRGLQNQVSKCTLTILLLQKKH